MRNDLKISLAVGAVLLAVIIVWAAVPRHAKQNTVKLVPQTSTNTQATDAQPGPTNPGEANPGQSGTSVPTSVTNAVTPAHDAGPGASAIAPNNSADSKNAAPDWAALLSANDTQLRTMMPQAHAVATPAVDHPDLSASTGGADAETTADHTQGGMTLDPVSPVPPTTRPTSFIRPGARTHTVQSGETLVSIAKSVYGRSGMYLAIEKANPSINANRLRVGTVLTLPNADARSSDSTGSSEVIPTHHARATGASADSTKEYRVQPGDSLHKISVKLYGNAGRADELYTSNKDVIGDDPAKLKVGEVLKLPEPPTATASR